MFTLEKLQSQDSGPCNCCGNLSRTVAGHIYADGNPFATYRVHWTLDELEQHGASFHLLVRPETSGSLQPTPVGVSIAYRDDCEAKGFMVVDAKEELFAGNNPLKRQEVIGTPLAKTVFSLLDFIWLNEDRINEITKITSL